MSRAAKTRFNRELNDASTVRLVGKDQKRCNLVTIDHDVVQGWTNREVTVRPSPFYEVESAPPELISQGLYINDRYRLRNENDVASAINRGQASFKIWLIQIPGGDASCGWHRDARPRR